MATPDAVHKFLVGRRLIYAPPKQEEKEEDWIDNETHLIIVVVLGTLAGLLILVGVFFGVVVWWRRRSVQAQYSNLVKLYRQASTYESGFVQLRNEVETYISRLNLDTGSKKVAYQEDDRKFQQRWQDLERDSDKFLERDYIVVFNRRRDDLPLGSQALGTMISGISIENMQEVEAPRVKGIWPKPPVTQAKDVNLLLKSLSQLEQQYRAVLENFQQLRDDVFPTQSSDNLSLEASIPHELAGAGCGDLMPFFGGEEDPKLQEEVKSIRDYAHPLLGVTVVKPYGVLGQPESGGKRTTPQSELKAVIVDPASWACISQRNSAKAATGASASIYAWLALTGGTGAFPAEVQKHFDGPQDDTEKRAKFHSYRRGQHVIHVTNPSVEGVMTGIYDLARTYLNLLMEFCRALDEENTNTNSPMGPVPRTLRLMPLSSGTQLLNKKLERYIAELTWSSLSLAFAMMPATLQDQLRKASLEVCVFKRREVKFYSEALERRKGRVSVKPMLEEEKGRLAARSGSYAWIRQKNAPVDRLQRLGAALQTVQAASLGGYVLPNGKLVELHTKDMLEGTSLKHAPEDGVAQGDHVQTNGTNNNVQHAGSDTVMEAATKAQKLGKKTVAVNAASAYSVGGGVLSGGRHALEEGFCTMSTLLSSLQKVHWEARKEKGEGYEDNGGKPQHIPVEGCVMSPNVEIFRDISDRGYVFQETATRVLAVCSVAMFNMNPRVNDAPQDAPRDFRDYCRAVKQKFRSVVLAAHEAGAEVLVCPDVGCGVFQNDATTVGSLFGEVLREPAARRFSEVIITGQDRFFRAAMQVAKGGKAELRPSDYFYDSNEVVIIPAQAAVKEPPPKDPSKKEADRPGADATPGRASGGDKGQSKAPRTGQSNIWCPYGP